MKTTKMSLTNILGRLSRTEMKMNMAGSGSTCYCSCGGGGTFKVCTVNWCKGLCYCFSGMGQC